MAASALTRLYMDVEGVVFDPAPSITRAMRRALVRIGCPASLAADLSWVTETPVAETLNQLVPQDESMRTAFLEHVRRYYCVQGWRGVPCYAGAVHALERARAELGVEVILVSAHPFETVSRQIQDLGLEEALDAVACPPHGGCAHCRTRLIRDMVEASPRGVEHLWITDLPAELFAARSLGITAVAAGWGRAPNDTLRRTGAPFVLDGPADVLTAAGPLAPRSPFAAGTVGVNHDER